jgi:hypothetical protein
MVACAGVRMRASVVAMTTGMTFAGVVTVGLLVTGMLNSGAGSRVGLLKRRRDDAGKLGDQKEGDQKPNRARLCPEPLHDSFGCSGKQSDFGPSGRERQSHACYAVHNGQRRLQIDRNRAPDGSCAERRRTPSLARISRLKTARAGSSPGAG